jgi:hypothetical protein
MKKTIRNFFIVLFYLTGIPFWRRLFLKRPLLRVWCLHEVKDNQVGQLKKKIAWVKQNFNLITPRQFLDKDFSKTKINLLMTFDDGYESWFKNVLPVLAEEGIKGIFFINERFRCYESRLLAAGHSLGGHGKTHAYLPEISPEELAKEVDTSVKSEFFAYPEGDKFSYNAAVVNQIKKAGYNYGFTILPGYNNLQTNTFALHRDSLDADLPDWLFKLWLKGVYDWKV